MFRAFPEPPRASSRPRYTYAQEPSPRCPHGGGGSAHGRLSGRWDAGSVNENHAAPEPLSSALHKALRVSRNLQLVMVVVWPVLLVAVVLGLVTGRFEEGPITGVIMAAAIAGLAWFSVLRLRNLNKRLAESPVEE